MTTPARPIPALVAPTSVTNVITRILTVAASQIGYREGRDSNGNWNNDTVYGVWYGMNFNPWCAMDVSWDAFQASIPETVIPKHAYTPSGWNWFKANKRTVSTPQRGDIMYVYSSSIGLVHHVGLVEKVLTGGRIQTIEGNTNTSGSAQGDGVYRLTRTVSSRLLFARPDYAACVTNNKPVPGVTPIVTPPKGIPAVSDPDIYAAHVHAKSAAVQTEALMSRLSLTAPDRPAVTGTGDAFGAHYWAKRTAALLPLVAAELARLGFPKQKV